MQAYDARAGAPAVVAADLGAGDAEARGLRDARTLGEVDGLTGVADAEVVDYLLMRILTIILELALGPVITTEIITLALTSIIINLCFINRSTLVACYAFIFL